MAKRNSTKTATKEALQASEPRLQAFRGWKGINFSEVSPLWNRYVDEVYTEDRQTDLAPNYLLVQNNFKTTAQASVETTFKPLKWCDLDDVPAITASHFTGVNVIDHDYGYFAVEGTQDGKAGTAILQVHRDRIDSTSPTVLINNMSIETEGTYIKDTYRFTDMHVYLDRFIAMAEYIGEDDKPHGTIFVSDSDDNHWFPSPLYGGYLLQPQTEAKPAPGEGEDPIDPNSPGLYSPVIVTNGELKGSTDPNDDIFKENPDDPNSQPLWSSQCTFYYCMTNEFGATQHSMWDGDKAGYTTMFFNIGPSQWTTEDYITISGEVSPSNIQAAIKDNTSYYPIGVDIYMIMNESSYPIFVGHADADMNYGSQTLGKWTYKFFGAMTDMSEWSAGNLEVPQDNSTDGVHARYVNEIDGRLYYWGDPEFPYRLYVGGNAGHELSIALGLGGAYIDIEPGSGCEIKMVEKFKTYGGSSIVTILCSNVNGTKQHRYNLIETNITTTSELSTAVYMVEEIANVVGTTSRHGGGAWSDGLYYINRNGLMVTTQAMEYNSQLRSTLVSDPVAPVFEEQKGTEIANSYVVCIKDIIYMATCHDTDNYTGIDPNIDHYNSFIWCYDIGLKSWYTIQPTLWKEVEGETVPSVLIPCGLFVYDHEDSVFYGLGVIDPEQGVYVSPLLNNQETNSITAKEPQPFEIHTAELGTSNPNTQWQWLCQLELNMDYFYGEVEVEVNGVDYYGRRMHIVKNVKSPLDDRNNSVMLTAFNIPIRIDTLVRYYHIIIKGKGMLRLNNIVARTYTQSKKIGLVYGFDAEHYYMDRFNSQKDRYMHDAVSCYNNLDKLVYEYRTLLLNPDHDVTVEDITVPILDQETAIVT